MEGIDLSGIVLPPGFKMRPARWDDLDAIAELTRVVCTDEGDPFMADSAEDLRRDWSRPGRDIERDAWVVIAPDGQLVGCEDGMNRHEHAILVAGGYVHPQYRDMGIGTALVRRLELWARQHLLQAAPGVEVTIDMGGINGSHPASHALLEGEGYHPARYFWRMEIEMKFPPPVPKWPDGITLRPFDPETQMHAVYEADEEAFREHWGYLPTPFEFWKHRRTIEHPLDPGLWHIAWDGDQIAGYSLNYLRQETGWIGNLGVRLPWRKRGLGLALLLQSFGTFHARGLNRVGLGVDAGNPSGAIRLYEKAGMQVVHSYITFEKQLRPGRQFSVELQED